jgi:polyhydroxyalkanoate synthesis regulator phasin
MSRKLHSIVFAVFILLVSFGGLAAFAQGAGQRGARRVAASQGSQAQLRARILGIKDLASLDAALSKLIGEGKLTQEQAAKIKDRWQKRQGHDRPFPAIDRLRAIQDEGKLNEALIRLVADGRITQDQAARIRQQWQKQRDRAGTLEARPKAARTAKAKKNTRPGQILNKIRGAKTEAKVDKMLNKLVSNGKITQEQAAKIKEQWKKRR